MSTLYIIGTPIGNLEDITLRALRLLKEADLILCEDTRVTKKLLDKYEIKAKLKRLDANIEGELIKNMATLFGSANNIAFVTDAGTPGISDPGARLVKAAREAGFLVVPIPGPSAVITALSASGITSDNFLFLGFLPHKKGRETLFKEIAESKRTVVFYESTHRIIKTLEALVSHLAVSPPSEPPSEGRKVVVARELTKIHEEIFSGTALEALNHFTETAVKQKGEFVVIVSRQ